MKTIVITGSTRGIGYGLADAFLALGCEVTVSGRTPEGVEAAAAQLATRHGSDRILSQSCDVTHFGQVQALWDATGARFGKVDIWINNAGINHLQMALWEYPPEEIKAVVETNLVGALMGARVALRCMLAQGFGSLYNTEGLGSDGRHVTGLTLYGCTKSGLGYLTDALVRETKETPILVGALRPGMVVTDFLTRQREASPEDWERTKRVLNLISDRVETVTPWLARKVLENTRTGVRIRWLTGRRMAGRFLLAPFRRRDVFG